MTGIDDAHLFPNSKKAAAVRLGQSRFRSTTNTNTAGGGGGGAPVNSVLPVISGTAQTGSTLTASTGTWTNSPTGYTYQWQSDTPAEVTQFLARASGLDAAHISAYSALIAGLVADGVWPKLDVLHIYATQTAANAQLNLISASYPATLIGAPTFTADRGYTGGTTGGTTGLINTSFIPSSAPSPKYTQNSAHVAGWSVNAVALNADFIGVNAYTDIVPRYGNNNVYCAVNGNFGDITIAVGDGSGFFHGNRSASNATQLYRNGGSIGTSAAASRTVPTIAMYSVGNNNGGTALAWGGQQAAISIGASLNATEALTFYNRLRTYMSAVGVP